MVKYNPVLCMIAKDLGKLRSKLSKKVYSKGEKYRGKEETRISFMGILGELIVWQYLSDVCHLL